MGFIVVSGISAQLVSQVVVHRYEVLYWHNRSDGADLILRKKKTVIAIEVKRNAEKNTTGLNMFKEMLNPK